MKTFKQFYQEAYQLDEFQIGNPLNNPLVKKVTQNPNVQKVLKYGGSALKNLTRVANVTDVFDGSKSPLERAGAAYGIAKPYSPVTYAPRVFNQGQTGSRLDRTLRSIPSAPGFSNNPQTDIGARSGRAISNLLAPPTASGKVAVKGRDGRIYYMDK